MRLFIVTTKNEMYVTFGKDETEVKEKFLKDYPTEIPIRIINCESEVVKIEDNDK